MYKGKKLIVVMLAYNAAKTLCKTYDEVMTQNIVDLVIVVDDASGDETTAIARGMPNTLVHAHRNNRDYGGNQKTCYRLALEAGPRGAHKTLVLGLRTRTGRVRSRIIPLLKTPEVRAILQQHVAKGTRLYPDELPSYRKARRWGFRHRRILHHESFTRGDTHIQGIEGYWGHLKPTLVAPHRPVSPKYLAGYLAEADHKHNLTPGTDFIREMLGHLLAPVKALTL